jgi:predicted AAA+ superfamily ATPase
MKLKLMLDSIDGLKILVTGSSVFDLKNDLGEPLVGRKMTFQIFPLAQMEFAKQENHIETTQKLDERLIFGSYPELEHLTTRAEKIDYLVEQVISYLLKDILEFEGIRKRETIVSLLRIIAFRVGGEISIEGISNELQIGKGTVDKYLDLLSKVLIIHKVTGFSRNLDNEITKKNKWYFYDNGIRNTLINNFNAMTMREDQGKLWENYLISERLKKQEYQRLHLSNFFWRTHTKQEIDWVEEGDGKIIGYEFKWSAKKQPKAPTQWTKAYPYAEFHVIHPKNYLDFID